MRRVQQELERTGYIPNMAGILLARNDSRILGVVVHDHPKYEGRVLEDGFVMSALNALCREVNRRGYFLMVKTTENIAEIPVFASMWNMDGLILMGFCETDYETLRSHMHISFVAYDGYFEKEPHGGMVNLVIDHDDGGFQAGAYLRNLGHRRALCIADNLICMDKERIEGFRRAFAPGETLFWQIPATRQQRTEFYERRFRELAEQQITAVFAVSDYYALDFMTFFQEKGLGVPQDIQIVGFDDTLASRNSHPALTTVHQDPGFRAKTAIDCLEALKQGRPCPGRITLPVELMIRESTRSVSCPIL